MKKQRLLKQSAVRAGAMTVVKLIGLVGRVMLTRMIGAEGIGLYQMVYSFYGFLLMLTGGLPTALAIITAKQPEQGRRLLGTVSAVLVIWGGIISLAVHGNARVIAGALGHAGLVPALHGLAPALFAVPLLALLRGYLQGQSRVGILALSEVAEQAVRVVLLLLIVNWLLPQGIERAVGGGLYATFAGALVSFALLTVYLILKDKQNPPHPAPYQKAPPVLRFVRTSLAISLTRLFIPVSELIDALLVPARLLAAGYNQAQATAMFGVVYGMAALLAYTPTLVTGALSHTLTARIAAEWQHGNLKNFNRLSGLTLKVGWLWGVTSGLFLYRYAAELSFFIFGTEEAAPVIRYLSAIPLIVGFRELTTSILWSIESRKAPVFGLLAGIICSIAAQYVLVGIPGFGYLGAVIAILSMEAVSALWNLNTLKKNGKAKKRALLMALIDLCVLSAAVFTVSGLSPSGRALQSSLWPFLFEAVVYFLTAGLYIGLRCIDARR